jgi:GAF domain-containing protein
MTPPEAPPEPRAVRWEAAHAVGRDVDQAGSTIVDVVAHGPGALVGLLTVCDAATHDVARAAAEEAVRLACEQLDAATDAIEAVTRLMGRVGRALNTSSPRPVAAVVAGPAQTAVAANDPESAVILTTDDRIYRPRAIRSRTAAPMAQVILDSREVGVVVLALPPAAWLPDLAREAIVWPNVQLGGAQLHTVASTGHRGRGVRQSQRPAAAGPGCPR